MSEQKKYLTIEEEIKGSALSEDFQKDALTFVAYMRENE